MTIVYAKFTIIRLVLLRCVWCTSKKRFLTLVRDNFGKLCTWNVGMEPRHCGNKATPTFDKNQRINQIDKGKL